jgi:hypothetical protein
MTMKDVMFQAIDSTCEEKGELKVTRMASYFNEIFYNLQFKLFV